MKVVVTGGTGFLGRHVVWRLAARGDEVVFTGRRAAAAAEVRRFAPAARWCRLEHGTPGASRILIDCAARADAIVHCAALSSPWGSRDAFHRANVASAAEVANACRAAGVRRLVHVSTPSIYFDFKDRLGIAEDAPLPKPANEYARTKALAERLVARDHHAETAILRPRALFGPWDTTLVPRLLRVLERGGFPLMRGGRALLDLTYVDNAVDAIVLALTAPLSQRVAVYNVSNGEPIEVRTLLAKISDIFGVPVRTRRVWWPAASALARGLEVWGALAGREPPLTRYTAGVLAFSQTLDIRAIARDLGYAPRVSIEEGMRRYAAWMTANAERAAS